MVAAGSRGSHEQCGHDGETVGTGGAALQTQAGLRQGLFRWKKLRCRLDYIKFQPAETFTGWGFSTTT